MIPSPIARALPGLALHGRRSLAVFILVFVAATTIGTAISRWPAPIYDDVAEAISWGRHLELGYYKHPPLFGWIAGLWFSVLPANEFTAYLLGAVNAGVGLLGVWFVAGRFLEGRCRFAAVAVLVLSPFWSLMATKFNANTVLLSVWPWTAYFFVRSIETRTMLPTIMFGVLCAAAMLAKYVSVMLLGACLAAALLHPSRVQYFRSPAPYVSMAVAAVLLTPHIAWSISHDFPTIKYALGKTDGDSLFKQWKGFKAAGVTSLLLSPMLFGIRLALGRTGWESISWTRLVLPHVSRAWLHMLAFGPLLLTGLLGMLGIVKVAENFFTPMIFLVPTAIISSSKFAVAGHRLQRSVYAGACVLAAWVLLSPAIALAMFGGFDEYGSTPSREAAREATRLWHETVGPEPRIEYVAGTERYALGMMFYIADRPSDFTHSYAEAPWVTPERIAESRLLAVCLAKDINCLEKVNALAWPGLRRFDRELRASFIGMEGPAREVAIFVLPPEKVTNGVARPTRADDEQAKP